MSALGERLAPAPLWAERGVSTHGLPPAELALSLVDTAVACEPTLSLPAGLLLAFEAAVRAQFERRRWRRAAAEAQRELEQLKALLQATSRAPYLTAHLISSGLLHELLALVLPSSSLTNEQVCGYFYRVGSALQYSMWCTCCHAAMLVGWPASLPWGAAHSTRKGVAPHEPRLLHLLTDPPLATTGCRCGALQAC